MTKLILEDPLTTGTIGNLTSIAFGPSQTRSGTSAEYTITAMTGSIAVSITFKGSGFTYDGLGFPKSGSATSCVIWGDGIDYADVVDFRASAKQLAAMRDVRDFYKILGDTEYLGTDGLDEIDAASGDDTIYGLDGNDQLNGNRGDDKLFAGDGDDLFLGSAGRDFINGGAGLDTYSAEGFGKGVKLDLDERGFQSIGSSNAVKLALVENLIGSANSDQLAGDARRNEFVGGAGADTLSGGGGNDFLDGGSGSDLLKGGAGVDEVSYKSASSGVTVSLALNRAQDTGGSGVDRVQDVEWLTGSIHADVLTGSRGANTIQGGFGEDLLRGGDGGDFLYGGFGVDTLLGGAAGDTLNGYYGADSLVGGAGNDRYVFADLFEANNDTISGFADGDIIDLGVIDAIPTTTNADAFSYGGQNTAFSGAPGNLFWYRVDGLGSDSAIVLLGDLNGDKAADFKIFLLDSKDLAIGDFIL